jgi:nucleoside-diphosphate-sugar epimerase
VTPLRRPAAPLTLVTGGAGYLGSTLALELLEAGRGVRVLDSLAHGNLTSLVHLSGRKGFEFVRADVRDREAVRIALDGVTEVVHLAAIVGDPACSRAPDLAREVNLEATRGLLEAASAAGVARLLFASTCSNYGKMLDGEALATEEWPLRPVSLYAETKVAAEREVLGRSNGDFTTCCLRFATIYGVSPRMRFDLTVNEFTRDALLSRELVVYGEQFWRPYVHVRDAARALTLALQAPAEVIAGEVYNVGDDEQNLRKLDLASLLTERLPGTQVRFVPKDEDPRDYRVSFEKVRSGLGFRTERKVPDGVEEIIALLESRLIVDPFDTLYRN